VRSAARPRSLTIKKQPLVWGCRGGLELLLENSTKVHKVEVTTPKDGQGKVVEVTTPKDGQGKVTMKLLLSWVKDNLIKERPEMFVKGDSVYVLFCSPLSSLTCVGSVIVRQALGMLWLLPSLL